MRRLDTLYQEHEELPHEDQQILPQMSLNQSLVVGWGRAAFPGGTGPKGDAVLGSHFKPGKEQTRKTGRELVAFENLVWMQTVLVPDHHSSPSFPRTDSGYLTFQSYTVTKTQYHMTLNDKGHIEL